MMPAFWIAIVASGVFAFPIVALLKAMKSRQTVSEFAPEGHAKKQGTPTMGGLIIAAGFVASLLALAFGASAGGSGDPRSVADISSFQSLVTHLLVLFVLFAAIGFVDDFVVPRMMPGKRGLGWKQKILMQFVAAMVYAVPAYSNSPLEMGIAVFLILFFSNAYNFSDGLDALAGSLLVTLSFGLIGIAVFASQFAVIPVLLALIGATVPFLVLNAPPAKVFMGDVGSLGIGAVLGAVVFSVGSASHAGSSELTSNVSGSSLAILVALGIVSLMMVVELVPVPLQIASVKLRHKKLFPYTPIHHAFEKAGWPESRVVWIFAICQFVLSALAVQIASSSGFNMYVQAR